MLEAFQKSDVVREAITLLGQCLGDKSLRIGRDEHAKIRNYLVTQVILQNATRAGGVTNMTWKGLRTAVFVQERSTYITTVRIHIMMYCYFN